MPTQPSMTITPGSRRISMSALGPESPLPMIGPLLESPYRIEGAIPPEIIDGARYGAIPNLYPHREQDGYSRERSPQDVPTIVLENRHLRAVFLPELGGRLWELVDLRTGKSLLHTPDTLQFANLALRNAWFAGGVEWNTTTRGHSPSTCSPVHAGIVETPDGREVLRMWEFDRVRGTVFQLDAWLPDDHPVLLVAARLRNPADVDVPVYWWANAAVPQHPANRVVAPADTAFASDEIGGITRVFPTSDGGVDCTWPTQNRHARDFFFDLAPGQRRWILQSDVDGDGLAIVSTDRLRGRKLFIWGQEPGGRRWQRWLSPESGEYSEIQAGLAQTQFEHLGLPAGAEWTWVEAYGNAAVDAAVATSDDWDIAVSHGEERVERLIGADALERAAQDAASWQDLPPTAFLADGTGWGALEAALRRDTGLPWIDESGTPFRQETLGAEQHPWIDLLAGGDFTGASSFVSGDHWRALLDAHRQTPESLAHLGTIEHAAGDPHGARGRYEAAITAADRGAEGSAEAERTTRSSVESHADALAIAHRGLALLDRADGSIDDTLHHYAAACAARPAWRSLLVEAATAAVESGRADTALSLIERYRDGANATDGRVALLLARALADTGRTAEAIEQLRNGIEIADLREGDNALADLWRRLLPGEPVPADAQFSMTGEQ